jgi:Fe-S-cluster containining protein
VTAAAFDCRTCGACCSYAPDWPRFTLESDAEIARIPAALMNAAGTGIRCSGDRCAALTGTVGTGVSCGIYAIRPNVCQDCMPGDEACRLARTRFGLPAGTEETAFP